MRIKRLHEYYAQPTAGDGLNAGNGVFRVSYKQFNDLSNVRGRDDFDHIPGQDFQVGDIVTARLYQNTRKEITGEIVKRWKSDLKNHYDFLIKDTATNRVHRVVPSSVEMTEDRGFTQNPSGSHILAGEMAAKGMKFGHGVTPWGTYESIEPNSVLPQTTEINEEEYVITITNSATDTLKKSEYVNSPDYQKCLDYVCIQQMKQANNWPIAKKIIAVFLDKNKESYGEFSDRMGGTLKKFLIGSNGQTTQINNLEGETNRVQV